MRTIDTKFHIEGEKIVKTSNGHTIPHDEPIFLLRARDYLAVPLLEHFMKMSLADGCTLYHVNGLREVIAKFRAFAGEHPDRMKQPGCTRGL